jgi:tetratricopeptide (TPR) repeat protein
MSEPETLRAAPVAALLDKARARHDSGDLQGAVSAYDAVIGLDPDHADVWFRRSNALLGLGRLAEALASYERTVELAPGHGLAWCNRGIALARLGRFREAVESYDRVLDLDPDHADTWFNRGNALMAMGEPGSAIESFDRRLRLHPGSADALNSRGRAQHLMNRPDEALQSFDAALALAPGSGDIHLNRGNALRELGRLADAIEAYGAAIAAEPGHRGAHKNRADLLMLQGDLSAMLTFDHWRTKPGLAEWSDRRLSLAIPLTASKLQGKTVLVVGELGLGDMIHVCRYLPILSAMGARVIFAPQAPLAGLMRSLGDDIGIAPLDDSLRDLAFDYFCPAFSLPAVFIPTLDRIPSQTPYLRADPDAVARWAARIGDHGFRIGVCWQGSTGANDVGRSYPLDALEPISKSAGVRLISLQQGVGVAQLRDPARRARVEDLGAPFDQASLVDTAAIISLCDLVITSDTSVAHLAGALDVPTWVALKSVPSFLWLLDRADNPWYPSMRLFRQARKDDWSSVFTAMHAALQQRLAGAQA